LWTIGALVVGIGLKIWLLERAVLPFNADEAVVALMARHIQGGARPVFFYGQVYMGSLDAIFIALGFSLFGQHVWVIRAVQGILYLGTLLTTIYLGRQIFGAWVHGILAGWLMAIPAINVTLYTTASLGNYGEALLIGNLTLIAGLRIATYIKEDQSVPIWLWCAWGLMVGLGWWAFGLTLIYSLPVGIYLMWIAWREKGLQWLPKPISLIFIGVLTGASPWLVYAFRSGVSALISELGGSAIAGIEGGTFIVQTGQHLVNFILFGTTVIIGLRPPWEIRWLVVPLLPFVLAFWMGVIVFMFQQLRNRKFREVFALMLGILATLILAFIFSPFGADPSGRYFLPFMVILALSAAGLILWLVERWGQWAWVLPIVILLFNFWGTAESAARYPPGVTTQFDVVSQIDHLYMPDLVRFLEENGEHYGYTNYWVAYPLAFHSQEEVLFVPRLPYHPDFRYTERDDRYAPYTVAVDQAPRAAYITTHHPALNTRLRTAFEELGLTWQEEIIGDYHVFFDISRHVKPVEIGLGVTTP
jgi:hypothetical protein